MGTHWDQEKKQKSLSHTSPSPPKGKKLDSSSVHAEPSHWLDEAVCHHFWHGLMALDKQWDVVLHEVRWQASNVMSKVAFHWEG
jgi:hypothetical protein